MRVLGVLLIVGDLVLPLAIAVQLVAHEVVVVVDRVLLCCDGQTMHDQLDLYPLRVDKQSYWL